MLKRLSVWVVCFLAGLAVGCWPAERETLVAFLSVGQGDCTLITSEGWVALIDVGPKTETFDAGKRLVLPELRRLGVRKIDCLFLTHPDLDHVGGLEAVATRFRIGRVVISREFQDDTELRQILLAAGISSSQTTWIDGINKSKFGQAELIIAAPRLSNDSSDNEGSLFVLIETPSGKIMTTGDAGFSAESQMIPAWDWNADVLKAGHHGSKGSMSETWLEETTPAIVVASCGVRNSYGHPNADAVARATKSGAKFLRTDQDGTVVFRAEPRGLVRLK